MQFKPLVSIFLFTILTACSTTSSQSSADARTCSDLSYGNKEVTTQSTDAIYNRCIQDKKKLRKQQSKDSKNLAILEFFFTLFLPSEE